MCSPLIWKWYLLTFFPGLLNKTIFVLSELIVILLEEQYSCSLDRDLCKPSAVWETIIQSSAYNRQSIARPSRYTGSFTVSNCSGRS